MSGFSLTHWIVVAIVVLVLFGRGKISEAMGDFGKGVSSFKKGMSEDVSPESRTAAAPPQLAQRSSSSAEIPNEVKVAE